jgi:spore coat polysaccharide biosynthesis protein SpsF
MKKPVVAVIQARMGSTRLANKMMLCLAGHPIIEWVYRRTSGANLVDKVVCALPDDSNNDLMADHLTRVGALVYRGAEEDVLGRCCEAAREAGAEVFVRVCADRPLIAPEEIDRLVTFFAESDYDYAYNHVPIDNCYPVGFGAEIASMKTVEAMNDNATDAEHREHMFNYLLANIEEYSIGTFSPRNEACAQPTLKLDVDTLEDYARLLRLNLNIKMRFEEIVTAAILSQ